MVRGGLPVGAGIYVLVFWTRFKVPKPQCPVIAPIAGASPSFDLGFTDRILSLGQAYP